MRKLALILVVLFSFSFAPNAEAKLSKSKLQTLGIIAGYGMVGGALLGTATLAFDAPGRSPFIGASLGLYAGLFFGAYIVLSHEFKGAWDDPSSTEGYYPDAPQSPYESGFSNPFFGGEEEAPEQGGQLWVHPFHGAGAQVSPALKGTSAAPTKAKVYFQLIQFQF